LKVLELFGGIGACTQALKRLGIEVEIADYVEIDKYAVASYNAINGTNFEPQDITKWDKDIDVDLIMHGSPCQDFSLAGKQAGGDEGSGTRSSLMYETLRIVENIKPKVVIWENVKNVLSKKHIHNFNNYLSRMDELGFNNYYKVLNSKDYGIPQNRERVFTISIRKDIDEGSFLFPDKQELVLKLKDMLEEVVDEKYFLTDKMLNCFLSDGTGNYPRRERFLENMNRKNSDIGNSVTTKAGTRPTDNYIKVKNATKQGYLEATDGDGVDISGRMQWHRGNVQKQSIQTITTDGNGRGVVIDHRNMKEKLCDELIDKEKVKELDVINHSYTDAREKAISENKNIVLSNNESPTLTTRSDTLGVVEKNVSNLRIRKLTPKECWRLMEFSDEAFDKASQVNSNTQLYKQAGNSIVVNVLEAIFKELLGGKDEKETI
jgi:DNA (cytosine-5)-methyltransferase 1